MAEKTIEIGEIKRNGSGKMKVSVGEYKGKPNVDIRNYYLDDNEQWAPTKKGVTFHSLEDLDTAIELLKKGREMLAAALGV